MKKRCLAALLALVLCLTLLPTAALADDSNFVIVDGVLNEYIGPGGEVTIPDGVTSIKGYAFEGCTSLTSVIIPDGVTSIGTYAFSGCINLSSVIISDSVSVIEYGAFEYCPSLTSIKVTVGNANYCSQEGVLFNKDKTALILCPEGKTGAYSIPAGVTSIEDFAFYLCTGLTSVAIPEGVTDIKFFAFAHCEGLTAVDIPESVISIEEGVFHCCTGLTRVTIPSHVTSVGSAFYGCGSLTDILVDPDNQDYTSVDGVLFTKDGKTLLAYPGGRQGSYAIPVGVTGIESGAFNYCPKLTIVTVPDSVTSIGEDAFYDYDCPNVTIHGQAGSAAEQYCRENEIPFVAWNALTTAWEGELKGSGGKGVPWAMTEAGELTVDVEALAPEDTVLAGCYDSQGRFTGMELLDASNATTQIDPATPNVKLFWLDSAQKPQSASTTVWGR